MVSYFALISCAELILVFVFSFLGAFVALTGYYDLTSDGKRIGILKMSIGAFGPIVTTLFQVAIFETNYMLPWLALTWIPALLVLSLIFQTNGKYRFITLVIAATIAALGTIVASAVCSKVALNAMESESDQYIRVETKGPTTYPLKDLGDGKYLLMRDGKLEYELLTSEVDSSDLTLSQDDVIKVLPLSEAEAPYLAITESWGYERYPGIKIIKERQYAVGRTVAIHVLPSQTVIAYSEP